MSSKRCNWCNTFGHLTWKVPLFLKFNIILKEVKKYKIKPLYYSPWLYLSGRGFFFFNKNLTIVLLIIQVYSKVWYLFWSAWIIISSNSITLSEIAWMILYVIYVAMGSIVGTKSLEFVLYHQQKIFSLMYYIHIFLYHLVILALPILPIPLTFPSLSKGLWGLQASQTILPVLFIHCFCLSSQVYSTRKYVL